MHRVQIGDRVCALASACDVFRRAGVVTCLLTGGLAHVELDAGGEELISTLATGLVIEESTGARRCVRFARAGWYVIQNARAAA